MVKNLLKKNILKFKKSKILCIGDIMLDEFIYGDVKRISPEAPVPILLKDSYDRQIGGAGNVARNIASFGINVGLLSIIGNDESSLYVDKLVRLEKKISPIFIKVKNYEMTKKTRFVNKSNQLLRVDSENTEFMNKLIEKKIMATFKKEVLKYNTVIISDYKKGMLNREIIKKIVDFCIFKNIKILADPKSSDFSIYKNIQVLTPNQKEFSEAVNCELHTVNQIVKEARKLIDNFNFDYIIVTRSEEGMLLISNNNVENIPTTAKDVFDVSGAGDTVISFIALGFGAGLKMKHAVQIANHAAGIVVGKKGTAVTNRYEMMV